MRIIAAAFLAAASVLIPATAGAGGMASPAAGLKAEGGALQLSDADAQNAENPLFQDEFIYVPPPKLKVLDPRFYPEAHKYIPDSGGHSIGKLVEPLWGALPAALANSPASAASGSSVTASSSAIGVVAQATSTPAPSIGDAPEIPETPKAAATETPTLASNPASSPEPSPTPPTAIKASGAITATGIDIEDPRFYRGSYLWDPESHVLKPGVIGAGPTVAKKSPPPAAGDCGDGASSGASCSPPPADSFPRYGRAMYYNPGIMEQVLAFRMEAGHVTPCPDCIGYVALLNREDLNRKVWLEWGDGDVEGPFLSVDAAAKQHVSSLLEREWVVDVDYETAMRRSMNRPMPVTVWDRRPGGAYTAAD